MLSAIELTALSRGQLLKRYVRAAAAMHDLYDDSALGAAVGRNRAAVGNWWRGARPEPEVIFNLADVTGLSADELTRFVYSNGPPPTLPAEHGSGPSGLREGARRGEEPPADEDPATPALSPERLPRDDGARHA